MRDKIEAFWQTLDEKKQLYTLAATALLAILILVLSLYLPLKSTNQVLNTQLQTQYEVQKKLINAGKNPLNISTISPKQVKATVAKIAKQKGLEVDLDFAKNTLTLNVKNQEFARLKNLLTSMRNEYAMITNKASIKRTKDGFVNANLTLVLP